MPSLHPDLYDNIARVCSLRHPNPRSVAVLCVDRGHRQTDVRPISVSADSNRQTQERRHPSDIVVVGIDLLFCASNRRPNSCHVLLRTDHIVALSALLSGAPTQRSEPNPRRSVRLFRFLHILSQRFAANCRRIRRRIVRPVRQSGCLSWPQLRTTVPDIQTAERTTHQWYQSRQPYDKSYAKSGNTVNDSDRHL